MERRSLLDPDLAERERVIESLAAEGEVGLVRSGVVFTLDASFDGIHAVGAIGFDLERDGSARMRPDEDLHGGRLSGGCGRSHNARLAVPAKTALSDMQFEAFPKDQMQNRCTRHAQIKWESGSLGACAELAGAYRQASRMLCLMQEQKRRRTTVPGQTAVP